MIRGAGRESSKTELGPERIWGSHSEAEDLARHADKPKQQQPDGERPEQSGASARVGERPEKRPIARQADEERQRHDQDHDIEDHRAEDERPEVGASSTTSAAGTTASR